MIFITHNIVRCQRIFLKFCTEHGDLNQQNNHMRLNQINLPDNSASSSTKALLIFLKGKRKDDQSIKELRLKFNNLIFILAIKTE